MAADEPGVTRHNSSVARVVGSYKRNHYVPQWYQYKFLKSDGEKKFHYLDLKPEVHTASNGKKYQRKALLRWGPPRCFYENDLYTTRLPDWESTEIEERFFGEIDTKGKSAVEYFDEFEHPSVDPKAFHSFLTYVSVQRLRTPKGLAYLRNLANPKNANELLFKMQELQRMHCALWTECVWSIVDASDSDTKFIISDNPVTFYNQECFPESKYCRGSKDPGIWLSGTYTIFPLGLNKALILTNLSWARDPYGSPTRERPNPELFRGAMFNFTSIQTGRKLSEQEVITINYIIKKRAYRYVAAAEKEWLHPEKRLKNKKWDEIGKSHLLMPDPRSMSFTSETFIGYGNGKSDAFDEYGRKPWQSEYKDENRHQKEWDTFHAFQGEFARLFGPKRRGLDFDHGSKDRSVDSDDYHAYHLGLEATCKANIKRTRRRK